MRGGHIILIYRLDLCLSFLTLTMKVGLLYVPECSLCHKGTLLMFESRKNPDSIFINLIENSWRRLWSPTSWSGLKKLFIQTTTKATLNSETLSLVLCWLQLESMNILGKEVWKKKMATLRVDLSYIVLLQLLFCRYGYRQLLEGSCADVIQPDITWMGGITEVNQVC